MKTSLIASKLKKGGGSTESKPHSGASFDKSLNTRITNRTRNLKAFLKRNAFWGLTRTHGFTLAEVLITLGIIGIVAAMTLPTLIAQYQKQVVETRLQKFYSNINQAVKLAEVQYGDKKIWFEDLLGADLDENGIPVEGTSESEKWFNKYLAPHLKIIKQETLYDGSFIVYFPDGSALRSRSHTTRDWLFIPSNAKKCIKTYGTGTGFGICQFMFNFNPNNNTNAWRYHYNKGFEPFKASWNGSEEHLMEGCKGKVSVSTHQGVYCTALIQNNGWKIPDDYPLKISY